MGSFFHYHFSLALLLSSSTAGAEEIRIRAVKGEDCALPCSRNTALELFVLEWSHSDLERTLLVFRGRRVLLGYEDPFYRNRVELLDPELQTDLSVLLKKVTEEDSGEYKCKAVYEDDEKIQEISQIILLTVTEPGTTNTELETETHREPSLGLILGLVIGLFALILVTVALCVLFLKQIKHEQFDSSECSSSEKLKEHPIPRSSSSSSSSPPSTLSHGSDAPFIKTPPSSRDTEQTTLNPPLYCCPPSSPPPGTPFLGGGSDLSALPLCPPPGAATLTRWRGLSAPVLEPNLVLVPGLEQD